MAAPKFVRAKLNFEKAFLLEEAGGQLLEAITEESILCPCNQHESQATIWRARKVW